MLKPQTVPPGSHVRLEKVIWTDSFSVGVSELDEQHKKLIGMINQLSDTHAGDSAERSRKFHEILSSMFDYTQIHFKTEESYLHDIAYPQSEAHQKEHASFVEKMATFSLTALDGTHEPADVHQYLKEWLLSHILKSDMQYRHFTEEKTVKSEKTIGARHGILIIDDDAAILSGIAECLHPHYQIQTAALGKNGLDLACASPQPDLILLDVELPDIHGYAVCTALKANPLTAQIPVIFMSSHSDAFDVSHGLELGAVDYVTKPVAPPILLARMQTHLRLREAHNTLKNQNTQLEELVNKRTQELLHSQDLTIFALGSIAETRDNETGNHIYRTSAYVEVMARRLAAQSSWQNSMTATDWELIWKSAPLHDIGKVGIPDNVLLKPGKLTPDEFDIMKGHSLLGYNAIRAAESRSHSDDSVLRVAAEIAYTHHERWDGKGYPQGLSGSDIPLSGRLMSLADVYDALISKRVYKPAFPHAEAVQIIREGRGSQFDPEIVDIFLELSDQFNDIALRFSDHNASYAS
jgi:putative two-component system response regulator